MCAKSCPRPKSGVGGGQCVNSRAKRWRLDVLPVQGFNGEVPLSAFFEETFADGVLVIKNDAIAFERYFNGMDERSLHLSQSVAKSFTGALAGILIGKGLLDVKAPVTEYLPELKSTAWNGASLQQVLDMSSGVRFNEEYTDPYSDIGQVDVASGWKAPPPGSDPHFKWPRHMWELILGLKQQAWPHGDKFEYRSIETDVLAFAMERVTGKRLPQLLSEQIWQKAGMEESANFTVDPAGYAIADGGLNACLRDYGRFGQLILEGGGGIIPSNWIEATRNGDHTKFGTPYSNILPRGAYHNQFWIEDPEHRDADVPRRVRPAHLYQLAISDGDREAFHMAGIHQSEIHGGHPAGLPCDWARYQK